MGLEGEVLEEFHGRVEEINHAAKIAYAHMTSQNNGEAYNASFHMQMIADAGLEERDRFKFTIYRHPSGECKSFLEKRFPRQLTEEEHEEIRKLAELK